MPAILEVTTKLLPIPISTGINTHTHAFVSRPKRKMVA